MTDIVDRLAEDDSLVGLIGTVDIYLGEQCRKLLDLFVDVITAATLNYDKKEKSPV
jgi:hypothetical protein